MFCIGAERFLKHSGIDVIGFDIAADVIQNFIKFFRVDGRTV